MKKVLMVVLAVGVGIIGLVILDTTIVDVKGGEDLPSSTAAMLDVMPVVFGACIVVSIVAIVFGGRMVYRYYKWSAYGNRLKEAYSAKFGGANPAFNVEVDMHISSVRAMGGSSMTKETNMDWLKRMAEFVEVPWAVPNEERLSEVEKTEQYASLDKEDGE